MLSAFSGKESSFNRSIYTGTMGELNVKSKIITFLAHVVDTV